MQTFKYHTIFSHRSTALIVKSPEQTRSTLNIFFDLLNTFIENDAHAPATETKPRDIRRDVLASVDYIIWVFVNLNQIKYKIGLTELAIPETVEDRL